MYVGHSMLCIVCGGPCWICQIFQMISDRLQRDVSVLQETVSSLRDELRNKESIIDDLHRQCQSYESKFDVIQNVRKTRQVLARFQDCCKDLCWNWFLFLWLWIKDVLVIKSFKVQTLKYIEEKDKKAGKLEHLPRNWI